MAAQGGKGAQMEKCARCGGRFPGPGVERDGKLHCCDMCAEGPKRMMPRILPIAALLIGAGALLGANLAKRRYA